MIRDLGGLKPMIWDRTKQGSAIFGQAQIIQSMSISNQISSTNSDRIPIFQPGKLHLIPEIFV